MDIPKNFRPLYSKDVIEKAARRLGAEISEWARESDDDIIAIPILRGGLFFLADLVRFIDHSVEIAPTRAWAYERDSNAVQRQQVTFNLEGVETAHRRLLLVDDICDSGRTLNVLSQELMNKGASEVNAAVVVTRELETPAYHPRFSAFRYEGKEWLVGYGMDDRDRWRNLPDIYTITDSVSAE